MQFEVDSFSRGGLRCTMALLLAVAVPLCANAQDADLAKKLSNPIASLISVPFQYNYDRDIGPTDSGKQHRLNVQPVIPITLNDEWNLISRTIVPLVHQDDVVPGAGDQTGMGDILQSLFFSPKEPTAGGFIWGVGPVFLLPTATDDLLGGEKLGLGPTGIVLTQRGPWTVGGLTNHVWSVAGPSSRDDISNTFLQPFLSYNTPGGWTYSLSTESTYDWNRNDWSVPISAQVSKLMRFGKQPVSLQAGVRYWAEPANNGPEGWGARLAIVFLFPK